MSILIVGLSGVTNGGKTTLCKNLLKMLPFGTKSINQDEYFLPEDSPLHVPCLNGISHHNWEILSSLDMDNMIKNVNQLVLEISSKAVKNNSQLLSTCFFCKDETLLSSASYSVINETLPILNKCQNHKGILLIDGFTIFDDKRLRELCNLKFFFTLSKDECYSRRLTRSYDPPDPPGYFENCVWPMYKDHLERIKKFESIDFLDGMLKTEDILDIVLRKILQKSIK